MIELERTFLARVVPDDIRDFESKEITDLYIPKCSLHPKLRIRKYGDRYEITKKEPIDDRDKSQQIEQTISITYDEYLALTKIEGKEIHKVRYYYKYHEHVAQFDIFKKDLEGLVLIDYEFRSLEDKESFKMPYFCLAEVTNEHFIAGGMICGKKYDDISVFLSTYNYVRIVPSQR